MKIKFIPAFATFFLVGFSLLPLKGDEPPLVRDGDLVALCGDSITEQARYSIFVSAYLQACMGLKDVGVMNIGRGGESATGFLESLDSRVLPFHPTVATVAYGMNDVGAQAYSEHLEPAIAAMKKAGVRQMVLGTGAVGDKADAPNNIRLSEISNAAKEIATKNGLVWVNVHDLMVEAREKAIAKYGDKYLVMGRDGVHPDDNGHLIMAYGFLKGLGCKGDIATLNVDMKAGTASGTEGNKVASYSNGTLNLESSRYPFCFYGDPTSPEATSGMIEFIPFNQDLNRYMLVVKNPPAEKIKVTWGKTSKTFTADQLKNGVNLAAEFLDNPFSEPFWHFTEALRHQQQIDQRLRGPNSLLGYAATWRDKHPETGQKQLEETGKAAAAFDTVVREEVRKTLVPVNHSIVLEPADT